MLREADRADLAARWEREVARSTGISAWSQSLAIGTFSEIFGKALDEVADELVHHPNAIAANTLGVSKPISSGRPTSILAPTPGVRPHIRTVPISEESVLLNQISPLLIHRQ